MTDVISESSNLEIQQLASVLGAYRVNLSWIRLNADMSIWLEHEDGDTVRRFALFAHEYLHYLHNYSTVAGICEFVCHLKLARLLITASTDDGLCLGSAALTQEERLNYAQLIQWQLHLRGDCRLSKAADVHGKLFALHVVNVRRTQFEMTLLGQTLTPERAVVTARIESSLAEPVTERFQLGYWVITEGIAHAMEKMIMVAAGRSTADMEASTPTFPYKVSELVIQAYTALVPTAEQALKIGLLALQSSDCGASFIEIVDELSKTPHSIDVTLHQLATRTQIHLGENLAALFEKMVNPECSGFSSRPVLHEAIAHVRDLCRHYLTERGHDAFFELPLGRMDPNSIEGIKCFLDRFPSCTIQHFGRQRGDLFYVGAGERSDRELQVMGAYQGFGYYMWAHLRKDGLVPTRSLGQLTCCFYGSCDVPFARTNSDVCQNTAWRAFDRHGTNHCWFAAGVGHARGLQAKIDPLPVKTV